MTFHQSKWDNACHSSLNSRLLKTKSRYTIQITAALQRYSDNRTYSIELNRGSKKSGKQYATFKNSQIIIVTTPYSNNLAPQLCYSSFSLTESFFNFWTSAVCHFKNSLNFTLSHISNQSLSLQTLFSPLAHNTPNIHSLNNLSLCPLFSYNSFTLSTFTSLLFNLRLYM